MRLSASEVFVILYQRDMSAARHFYEDLLGLELREVTYDWFVGYRVSGKRELTLCLSSSPIELERWGADGRGVVIDFLVEDVDATYRELVALGVAFDEPPTDQPWRLRTATFRDPGGYTLTISSYRHALRKFDPLAG